MHNSIENEIELFSILQKKFSKTESIKLYYYLIPNGLSNKLNRFYSDSSSLWFSRLVGNNGEILYYFGSMADEKLGQKNSIFPRVIFKFSENINNSSIHLINDKVALLIKKPKNKVAFKRLKELKSKLTYVNKELHPDLYYIILGEINSKKFFSNLDEFIKTFNFEIDFNSNKLIILDVLKENNEKELSFSKRNNKTNYYFQRLKFNLMAIDIKNHIEKTKLSFSDRTKLNRYIFKENIDEDFYFDKNFKKLFDKNEYELLDALKLTINSLSNETNYDIFLKKMIDLINNGKSLKISNNEESEIITDEINIVNTSIEKGTGANEDKVTDEIPESIKDPSENEENNNQNNFELVYSENYEFIDFEFKLDLSSDLIKEILSNISIESSHFIIKSNFLDDQLKKELISDLNAKTSNIMFKFKTKSFNDEERELIVNQIENDILKDKIKGDINSIIDYYLNQYKENKNSIYGLKFLEGYIKSISFKELIDEYSYNEKIVNDIINKVTEDITINKLEYEDITTKFEIYFRSFESNKKYYDLLEKYRNNINVYAIQYNLTNDELNIIFNKTELIIDENNGTLDIENIITKEIENYVLESKSEAFEYVNNIPIVNLMNDLELSEENCEKIKKVLRELIYKENLRKSKINKEYLRELRDKMIRDNHI